MKFVYMSCLIVDCFLTGVDFANNNVNGWTYMRLACIAWFSYVFLEAYLPRHKLRG